MTSCVPQDDVGEYYRYLRDEIKREDEITHQRMTSSLTLQGFLITSMALILSTSSDQSGADPLTSFEGLAILAIGFIGLTAAFASFVGVRASRVSLGSAKVAWEQKLKDENISHKRFPQAYGKAQTFRFGSLYALMLPGVLIVMWIFYLVAYLVANLEPDLFLAVIGPLEPPL